MVKVSDKSIKKVIKDLECALRSGNSIPVEFVRLKPEQFKIIKEFVELHHTNDDIEYDAGFYHQPHIANIDYKDIENE